MADKTIKGLDDLPEVDESQGIEHSSDAETDLSEVQEDLNLEKEFGNSPIRTAAESALSSATFGISDQVLTKSGLIDARDLRERRARNEEAAVVGEIAGIVAPAVLSGGTSLAAKGVVGVGKGVQAAAKASVMTEKVVKKAIEQAVAKSGNKSIAKSIIAKSIPKVAGSAVEGSAYGLGELVKEDALGTAEFNAQNALAHAGMGAAFGGAAGGLFGVVSGVVPVLKNNKITDYTVKKFKNIADADTAAWGLGGASGKKMVDLKYRTPEVFKNGKNFLKNRAKIKHLDNATTRYEKVLGQIDSIGKEIGKTVDDVDSFITSSGNTTVLPTRRSFADNLINELA